MNDEEVRECDNPLCDATLESDPIAREAYCGWECAKVARSGEADRILQERDRDES